MGGDPEVERLRQLEGACGETGRELARIQERGAIAAGEYDELSRRLAAIAVWVRASLIHGGPQPPPEELEEPGRHDKPGESGA